jgi:hypothetical protein
LVESNSFVRLITARFKAEFDGVPLAEAARQHWPNDHVLDLIVRAATAPAMTTVSGWAAELAQRVVSNALAGLGPMSAGAKLLGDGLVLTFDQHGSISVPGFVASAANGGFVAEGAPIPVRQLVAAGTVLQPYKLASIAALTEEMARSSNAEALIGDALMRSAGLALDQVLFDSNAADASRPAGLRHNIATSTPSSATDPYQAFLEDLGTLFNAVGQVGGPGPYALVVSPGRAMGLRSRMSAYDAGNRDELLTGLVLGSPAVGNDLIAVAQSALVAAFSPDPQIETSNATTLVMDDTAPSTPDTTQATKSMYQTASIATKMRWPVSWALRDPRGLAWLTPTWK